MVFSWLRYKLRWWGGEDLRKGVKESPQSHIPTGPGQYVNLSLGKTHYFLKGPIHDTTAPLVILLHGASVFSFIWDRFAELLEARGFRVLCMDFYGHGFSAVPEVKYTRYVFEQQLEELLEYLNLFPIPLNSEEKDPNFSPTIIEIDPSNPTTFEFTKNKNNTNETKKYSHEVYLIGHSMGGLVATEFAAKHKHMITKLVLFNAAGLPVDISFSTILPLVLNQLIKIVRRTEVLDSAAYVIGRLFGSFGHRISVNYEDVCSHALRLDEEVETLIKTTSSSLVVAPNGSRSMVKWFKPPFPVASSVRFAKSIHFLLGAWLLQSRVDNRAVVLLSIVRDLPLLDADHSKTIQQLHDVPILVIWGEEDGILPVHLIKKFRKHAPHAIIMQLPGSDHAAFLQKPKTSFDFISKFIANDFESLRQHEQKEYQLENGETVRLIKP